MGFWSGVGAIAKGAVNKMEALNAEVTQLAEEYRQHDDEYLKKKRKSNSTAQKAAAARVLKERGYNSQGS